MIAAERRRQVEQEGWSAEHDEQHDKKELLLAACTYAMFELNCLSLWPDGTPRQWPWESADWKPSDDPIRNLVKAGALIAAEIDRLQRLSGGDGG